MSKIRKEEQSPFDQPKEKYRLKNWSSYNQALINRGSITIYFSEEAITGWYDEEPIQKGFVAVNKLKNDLCSPLTSLFVFIKTR